MKVLWRYFSSCPKGHYSSNYWWGAKSIWPLSGVDKNTPSSSPAREETLLDEKQNDFETLPEFQTTSALGLTWLERLNTFTEKFPLIYLKINRYLNLYLTLRFTYFAKKKIEKPKSVFLNVFFWTKHNWSLEMRDQRNPHGYKQCDWLCLNNLAPSYYCYFNVVCTALAASLTKPITVFEYYQDFSKWAQANFTWGNLKRWCKICRVYVLQLENAL